MTDDVTPRVLLKLSGEAFCRPGGRGVDAESAAHIAAQIADTAASGVEVAVVVGGGNVFRGAELAGTPVQRDSADRMGMLATVMNGLLLRDQIRAVGRPAALLTGLRVPEVAETFTAERARALLGSGSVVVLAGGTGHPFFTTDTAAALRALEIGAHRLLKATKVDGVYSADPATHPDAERFEQITFDECLARDLGVMDGAAFALCRDNALDVIVFDMRRDGAIQDAALGRPVGTRVTSA